MKAGNSNLRLNNAKNAKKDEFYTPFDVIEKEMKFYKDFFYDKTVFCNCDDPRYSKFFKYFLINFYNLHLKKLISVGYQEKKENGKGAIKAEVTSENLNYPDKIFSNLEGSGSFISPESLKLLEESDIVVTNPPFSKFRDFIKILIDYKKKFLILGNLNELTCKKIFPLFKENKCKIGITIHSGDVKFIVPDDYPLNAQICGIDEYGHHFVRVTSIRWFTNFPIEHLRPSLVPTKSYVEGEYDFFDNYPEAINIKRISEIPKDFPGVMGVPITFFDKYDPDGPFEILGFRYGPDGKRLTVHNKEVYVRVLIRNKNLKSQK